MNKPEITEMEMDNKQLVTQDIGPLKIQVETLDITLEQVRKFIAPTATQAELFMFMGACRSFGLSPLKREIHFVKYGTGAGSIVVGYETYIARAEATGKLDGWEVTMRKDELGEKAICTIHRKDWTQPFVWEVYRHEFDKASGAGKRDNPWNTMPSFMLKKVVIGQAMRLCFPGVLAGMPYLPEEVGATGINELVPQAIQPAQTLAELRVDYFKAIKGMFEDEDERHGFQKRVTGEPSLAKWDSGHYDNAFAAVEDLKESRVAEEAEEPEQPETPEKAPESPPANATADDKGKAREYLVVMAVFCNLDTAAMQDWWAEKQKAELLPAVTIAKASPMTLNIAASGFKSDYPKAALMDPLSELAKSLGYKSIQEDEFIGKCSFASGVMFESWAEADEQTIKDAIAALKLDDTEQSEEPSLL